MSGRIESADPVEPGRDSLGSLYRRARGILPLVESEPDRRRRGLRGSVVGNVIDVDPHLDEVLSYSARSGRKIHLNLTSVDDFLWADACVRPPLEWSLEPRGRWRHVAIHLSCHLPDARFRVNVPYVDLQDSPMLTFKAAPSPIRQSHGCVDLQPIYPHGALCLLGRRDRTALR